MFTIKSSTADKIRVYETILYIEDSEREYTGIYKVQDNHLLKKMQQKPFDRIILDDPLNNLIIGVQCK